MHTSTQFFFELRNGQLMKVIEEVFSHSIEAEGADLTSGFFSGKFTDDEEGFKVSAGFGLRSEEKGM